MTGHELGDIGRTIRGMTALAPARPVYASYARCECGERFHVNEAPSRGGRRTIERRHAAHVAEVARG